jgi:dihydroorotate dehydrogenase (fumarate)
MDLSTTYLGMNLKHPIVPSSSPLSYDVDGVRRFEDAGAAAVVMHSLFEEQITLESEQLDHFLSYGTNSFAEALTYFPEQESYNVGPEKYLNLIHEATEAVDIPIIGSLNGVSTGGWIEYAKKIQDAGADALELNIYYIPTNPIVTGPEVEQMYLDIVRDVVGEVTIPVAVKLNPFFSATANMAVRLCGAGAKALVMFNRFYQPDLDIEELEVVSSLKLSRSSEMRLPLRWVAILYGHVPADLAITTGVHSHVDVLKGVMAGANITMMASNLLENGPQAIAKVLRKMEDWMEEHEYESVTQMRGSMSQAKVAEPAAFERANYMKVLQSWTPDPSAQRA